MIRLPCNVSQKVGIRTDMWLFTYVKIWLIWETTDPCDNLTLDFIKHKTIIMFK